VGRSLHLLKLKEVYSMRFTDFTSAGLFVAHRLPQGEGRVNLQPGQLRAWHARRLAIFV